MTHEITMTNLYSNLECFNRMINKLHRQGGVIVGYHGTSVSRKERILKSDFKNYGCAEGNYRVYFWDEEVASSANSNGRYRSK